MTGSIGGERTLAVDDRLHRSGLPSLGGRVGVTMVAVVLAHQGGWDEILLFAVPITGVVLLIRWLEARARRRSEDEGPIE
jgi:ABC-type cobalamin transport system permease subunit